MGQREASEELQDVRAERAVGKEVKILKRAPGMAGGWLP